MLTCMDEGIGNVTSALESKTMLENMFIIFTTDNVRALGQRLLLLAFNA
jgi:arylsulfatase A-like enzyme